MGQDLDHLKASRMRLSLFVELMLLLKAELLKFELDPPTRGGIWLASDGLPVLLLPGCCCEATFGAPTEPHFISNSRLVAFRLSLLPSDEVMEES